eukprot:jgi/Mesen1/4299/ME000022S03583
MGSASRSTAALLTAFAFAGSLVDVLCASSPEVLINVGSKSGHLDSSGREWAADTHGQGQALDAHPSAYFRGLVADDMALYSSAAFAGAGEELRYRLPAGAQGRHLLRLHFSVFSTPAYPSPERAVLSVKVDGARLLSRYSPFAESHVLSSGQALHTGVVREAVLLLSAPTVELIIAPDGGGSFFACLSAIELVALPGFAFDAVPGEGEGERENRGAVVLSQSLLPHVSAPQPDSAAVATWHNMEQAEPRTHIANDLPADDDDNDMDVALSSSAEGTRQRGRRALEGEMDGRRAMLAASCLNCPKSGAGLSRCFLCKAYVQPRGTYYSTRRCRTPYCSYLGGKTYPRAKNFR